MDGVDDTPAPGAFGTPLDDEAQCADLNIAAGQTEAERDDKGLGWPVTGAVADCDVRDPARRSCAGFLNASN